MFVREKKYRWIKIANDKAELSFGDSDIAEVEIEEHRICIARTISGLKACSSKCPHAGGDMSQGKLDKKGNIVCPVHGYIFNLNNGRDSNFEGYFLKIYPIREGKEGVFVGIEAPVFAD
jgi:3-phenylpropionate/trans-cinnamate dioxygenase ferredoxin subunit